MLPFTRAAVLARINIAYGLEEAQGEGGLGAFMREFALAGPAPAELRDDMGEAMERLMQYALRRRDVGFDLQHREDDEARLRLRLVRALIDLERQGLFVDEEVHGLWSAVACIGECVVLSDDGQQLVPRKGAGHAYFMGHEAEWENVALALGLMAWYIAQGPRNIMQQIITDMGAWPEPMRLRVLRDAVPQTLDDPGSCCSMGEPVVVCARLIDDLLPNGIGLVSLVFGPLDVGKGNENVRVQ